MTPPLSPDEAADLHQACLSAVWEQVTAVPHLNPTLVVSPDDRVDDLCHLVATASPFSQRTVGIAAPAQRGPRGHAKSDNLAPCESHVDGSSLVDAKNACIAGWPQGSGDLGNRLFRSAERAFRAGAEGVILLGADSPTLPADHLTQAVEQLVDHDAVMGPTEDGGYDLLGLKRCREWPSLLERIDWGTDRAADQTRRRAEEHGLRLAELPTWYDLDRFDDLRRIQYDRSTLHKESKPAMAALYALIQTLIERHDSCRNSPA